MIPTSPWDVPSLLKELEHVYIDKKKDAAAWEVERASVDKQLAALSTYLSQHYSAPTVLDRGGSGILLKVHAARLHDQPWVIKFPRPLPQNAPDFAALLDNEIRLLAEMRSRSVVVIHEAGHAPLSQPVAGLADVPFYIMDYIDGKDSHTYISSNAMAFPAFLSIVRETIAALAKMHRHQLVHLDIKPKNILIDNSGYPVLVDLGTTKRISNEDVDTKIACTFPYAPKQLQQHLTEKPSDPSRAEGTLRRSAIRLSWDLHSLGRTIHEWVSLYLSKNIDGMTPYQRKYLLLMALRMLQDPYDVLNIQEYGLQNNLLEHLRYTQIDQALVDIDKLAPGNDLSSIIPEFDLNHHKTIQGGSNEATTFTARLAKTMDHPVVRRLAELSHLGIVQLVYPTCTHTRLEHSLGTYHNTVKYIRSLYYDPLNPIFRQIMEPRHLRAGLLAALLHDVGQFPLAHDFEDIDTKLFNHTTLVRALIIGERDPKVKGAKKMVFPSLDEVFALWEVQKEEVLSILQAKTNQLNHSIRDRIIKSLISGPIDADKLDYLLRDARQLRVPYPEGIDFERLLRCLTLVIKDHANGVQAYVGVHEKGRIPAEYVTFARYAMFAQVYWHHSVRSAKAMLSRGVNALVASFGTPDEKNRFRYEFEHFVLFGCPYAPVRRPVQQPLFDEATSHEPPNGLETDTFGAHFSGTALNAWDVATLRFVKNALETRKLVEAELLDDLIERRLYKRVFVFSAERDRQVWNGFAAQWNGMGALDRRRVLAQIENAIVAAAGIKITQNPETLFLTEKERKSMELRVSAGRPLVLLDIPADKPGAQLPLEYVMEEDRRDLRKSNRICGRSIPDPVWEQYAAGLWEKAGRIRVFVHPDFVEPVRSAIDKKWMSDVLEDLSAIEEKALNGVSS